LSGNYLNEENCDVYIPGRTLKTKISDAYRVDFVLYNFADLFHAPKATLHNEESCVYTYIKVSYYVLYIYIYITIIGHL